jgi:hypothetical protein
MGLYFSLAERKSTTGMVTLLSWEPIHITAMNAGGSPNPPLAGMFGLRHQFGLPGSKQTHECARLIFSIVIMTIGGRGHPKGGVPCG